MRRYVLLAINAVFFVGCCFLVADMANRVAADSLVERATVAPLPAVAAAPQQTTWDARQPILDRNLFGATLFGGEEPEEEVAEDLEETKLPLTLLATIAANDDDVSRAAIHDNRTRSDEVLRPGETLANHPGVRLDRIERGRVLLVNKGRREELLLADADTISALRPPPARTSARRPTRARGNSSARAQRRAEQAERLAKTQAVDQAERSAIHERMSELSELVGSGEMTAEEVQAELEALNPNLEP